MQGRPGGTNSISVGLSLTRLPDSCWNFRWLKSLNLRATTLGTRGPGRCPPSTGLTSLDLWSNGIGAEGARALAALTGLRQPRSRGQRHRGARGGQVAPAGLTSLSLGTNGMRGRWPPSHALTSLDLWGNGIGDAGARALSALTCPHQPLSRVQRASGPRGPGRWPRSRGLAGLVSGRRIGRGGARALATLTGLPADLLAAASGPRGPGRCPPYRPHQPQSHGQRH